MSTHDDDTYSVDDFMQEMQKKAKELKNKRQEMKKMTRIRKNIKTKFIGMRIPIDLLETVKQLSKEGGRNLSQEIILLICKALEINHEDYF